ncbi:hypothetical protein T484DRAFT_1857736 [Baffinella frigidus]|nr:hypothetical protein T484DRAFT_1857736 [Cryptophyta sp. CCMP2293]
MFEVRRTALWAGGATAALAMGLIVLTAHLSQPSALLGRSAPLRFSAIDTEHRVTAPAVHQADASAVDDAPPVPYSAAKMADDPPLAVEMYASAPASPPD